MSSPTKLSLRWLRDRGYVAHVVEKRIPFKNITVDCFGGDILAVHVQKKEIAIVQTTSKTNLSQHIKKCQEMEAGGDRGQHLSTPRDWIAAGGKFYLHGWKKGKVEVVKLEL